KMKEFDLEKALAGEPVVLRNGSKGYVTADYSKFFPFNTFLYQGVFQIGKSKTQFERNSWTIDGSSFFEHNKYPHLENPFDIVGMWEEPRP
ncbi:TPA: pyruvate kinase, partial [Pasteurella multocida]|nr:pyruvate kinase [Pasteurella multocida]